MVPAGAVNETTVASAVDLFPTLCALAEIRPPDGITFDGEDLSAVFRGAADRRHKPLFWEYGRKASPEGTGGLRAFPYPGEALAKSPNVALREGDWKLLINADGSAVELYNLAMDAVESDNLAAEKPELARQLSGVALEWRNSLP
jgi:arylsulfatase A-like enzyme